METFACQVCAEIITVGPTGLDQDRLHRKVCGACESLRFQLPTHPIHPFCRKCSWRKGGIGAWNDKGCKCGHYEPPYQWCTTCSGQGGPHCKGCDGSGLVGSVPKYT
jgi:hypothetical protein